MSKVNLDSADRPAGDVDGLNAQRHVIKTRHGMMDAGQKTLLMGIINVTPDSFSDGGKRLNSDRAVADSMVLSEAGADIIDIGGESTRPGARLVSVEEELERVLPAIKGFRRATKVPISIDTYKAEVAQAALIEGADIVNDISALRFDPQMAAVVAREKVPIVLMHMQGTPKTMQAEPCYHDVLQEVQNFLTGQVRFAIEAGVERENIIIDPGIGFGKTLDHNLTLLRNLPVLASIGQPLLVGASRKAFIGKILGAEPEERLQGSVAAAIVAAWGGAHIVRVHDVRETREAIRVADAIRFGMPRPERLSRG
jgi:dihydropteroate synthase